MDGYRVGLVIPAFNEEETIGVVVRSACEYGIPIVVDDGSTDNTARIAQEEGAIVVRHTMNMGYDHALSSGFVEAINQDCTFIITIDADGQHDTSLLKIFIDSLLRGNKLVLGVRNKRPRISEQLFSFYTRMRYGVQDPLCGMKGYHRSVYETIGFFDSYQSIGTELMLRAVSSNTRFDQIHFNVLKRRDKPRFGRSFSANIRILRSLFLWLLQ